MEHQQRCSEARGGERAVQGKNSVTIVLHDGRTYQQRSSSVVEKTFRRRLQAMRQASPSRLEKSASQCLPLRLRFGRSPDGVRIALGRNAIRTICVSVSSVAAFVPSQTRPTIRLRGCSLAEEPSDCIGRDSATRSVAGAPMRRHIDNFPKRYRFAETAKTVRMWKLASSVARAADEGEAVAHSSRICGSNRQSRQGTITTCLSKHQCGSA